MDTDFHITYWNDGQDIVDFDDILVQDRVIVCFGSLNWDMVLQQLQLKADFILPPLLYRCHGSLRSSTYFQNVVPLFNPFLTSAGRVTGYVPDPSGSRASLIEVTIFAEKYTSSTQVVPSTISFYCVFPRTSRWTDVSLPVLDQFVFVTGLLQGISVINGHGGKCPCILIVELSFIPAPSFPDQAAPETPTCLKKFRQAIGFGSPITPPKTPRHVPSASTFKGISEAIQPSTSTVVGNRDPSSKS
ncbi:hypothetical protein V8E54_011934 [Elaphomyces granulatus]